MTRIEYETIETEFAVEQINTYVELGITLYLPMPPLQVAHLVAGARNTDAGVKIHFENPSIPALPVRGEHVDILVLRP